MSTNLVAFFSLYFFLQSDFGVVADRDACRKQRTSTGRSNRFHDWSEDRRDCL